MGLTLVRSLRHAHRRLWEDSDLLTVPGLKIELPPRQAGAVPLFRVVRSADVYAQGPREAAVRASQVMADASAPRVLRVLDCDGRVTVVDLFEPPQ